MAVDLLEGQLARGVATERERLLLGVLSLLPPIADYDAAARIFLALEGTALGFEAAVWDAYRFATVLPSGSTWFSRPLRSCSTKGVATHMLSHVELALGNVEAAIAFNRESRAARSFPFNLVLALKIDPALDSDSRRSIWDTARELVVSRQAELDAPVGSTEASLQRRWDNLILGTRLTSVVWEHYIGTFSLSGTQ